MSDYWGVVPAAGCGERFDADTPKQYVRVAGDCVLDHSLAALLRGGTFRAVVVSLAEDDARWPQTRHSKDPRVMTCGGGASRARSVLSALELLREQAVSRDDWVVVHDAVRPCLDARELSKMITALSDDKIGGLLAAPASDTMKRVGRKNSPGFVVEETLDRERVMRALTPQMFRFGLLHDAIDAALDGGREPGDEAQAMELAGHRVRAVAGDGANIKLTHAYELPMVEAWLTRHAQ